MFNRKESKKIAKQKLKKHYLIFVVACLLASFIGVEYRYSSSQIKSYDNEVTIEGTDVDLSQEVETALSKIVSESLEAGEKIVEQISADNKKQDFRFGILSIGYRKGVFAGLANSLSSGSPFVVLYKGIVNSFHASDVFAKIAVVLAALIVAFATTIFRGAFNVTYRRLFLEGYNYKEVKAPRYLFLIRNKKWFKAAFICFVKELYQFFWAFTIVGGIIKSFSYSQTEYIAAENPTLTPSQAITLSRKIMDGHKWELFKHQLTFLGWDLLNIFTLGLSGIFFSNPYKETFLVEYFVYLRDLAIENRIEGYELFSDKYLYECASNDELTKAYPDVKRMKNEKTELPKLNGVKGFFARNFGVVLSYNSKSNNYNEAIEKQNRYELYNDIFNLENYPARLAPIPEDAKYAIADALSPSRLYSLTSLIMMFFIFAFVGWSWEVLLHLVNDGVFVNRGVMHGPWLPIYGAGVVMILIILYRTRKSLPLHFVSSIVLCGVVEYFTSYYLELTKGIKWWDYTGYFLNINGRVCAEGLLVFGLGGTAAVFLLAPLLDSQIRRVKPKVLTVICVALLSIFVADAIYSKSHPNTGKGITDYKDETVPVTDITMNNEILEERYEC